MSSRQSTSSASSVWYKNPLVWVAVVAVLAMIGHFGPPADSSASVAPTPEINVSPTPVTIEQPAEAKPVLASGFCSGDNNIIVIGDTDNLRPILALDHQAAPPVEKECADLAAEHAERVKGWEHQFDALIVRK